MAREGEADLFGRALTRRELRRRVGRAEQVAGVTPLVFDDGPVRGTRVLQFRTGGGLAFDVLPDRGLDLGVAEYRSVPLAWLSQTGGVAPSFYEPEGEGWLRSFGGGLLVTCGLQNVGPPGERDGEALGLHGRVSNTPASNVWREEVWDEEGCVLLARGEVRESRVFGPNLALRRSVSARLGDPAVLVEDEVENEGFRPEPLMLLYHINLGWPLLDEGARLAGPGRRGDTPEPRDEVAAAGLQTWDRFDAPTSGFAERVYYHRPAAGADGWAEARLENPALRLALSVRFRPEELPEFVQWTMTGEGTYVLGLEPATCRVSGYEGEEAAGRVIWLEPGAARRYRVEIRVSPVDAAGGEG
jgi:Domain of unknown function (DUF4432)